MLSRVTQIYVDVLPMAYNHAMLHMVSSQSMILCARFLSYAAVLTVSAYNDSFTPELAIIPILLSD